MHYFHTIIRTIFHRIGRIAAAAVVFLAAFVWVPTVHGQGADQAAHVPGRVLVKFKDHVTEPQRRAAMRETLTSRITRIDPIGVEVLRTSLNANDRAIAARLRNRPDVEFAEVDVLLPPGSVPNDPHFGNQWHLTRIDAPGAWQLETGSDSITIAILDTGVDAAHPDLAAKLVPGWNTFSNNSSTNDVHGHGTRVAGTATAATHNLIGVAGVAWDCRIMPVRVTNDQGYASYSTIANGLIWAANNGARVANVSFRASESSTVANAAGYFQDMGGVVTVAAGNQGEYIAQSSVPTLLTVSATSSNDGLASFTNTGNIIDVAAPGLGILTTVKGGSYGSSSGTSFSAPVVAGVAALVLSANPSLSGADAQAIILAAADDLGPTGWDPGYGWGRVNAANAVSMALYGDGAAPDPDGGSGGDDSPPPPVDNEPPTIAIISPRQNAVVSGQVDVVVDYADNVGVVKVELWVNGSLSSTRTSPPFTTKLNTNPLPAGPHELQTLAFDAAGNVGYSQVVIVHKPTGRGGRGGGGGGNNAGRKNN